MAYQVTKIKNNKKQPNKQKLIILVNKNQKAFETIDGTCTIPPISDISGFSYAHVWFVCFIKRVTWIWTALVLLWKAVERSGWKKMQQTRRQTKTTIYKRVTEENNEKAQ